jgi:outer membrane protein insertion porin family
MRRRLSVFVLAEVLVVAVTAGQTGKRQQPVSAPAAAPSNSSTAQVKFPITSIVVKGNKSLPADQIIRASGLKIGESADKARFEEARKQLEATGMLDSIGYQFDPSENGRGYVATFNVDEVSPLYRVQFEGLNASRDDIDKYLKSKEALYNGKLPPTTFIIDRYTREIETYLASVNHPAKLVSNVVPSGSDSYDLVFRSAGALPSIAEVTFEGNKAVLITDLEHAINEVAYGTPYSEYTFKLLLDNQIKPLYENKGYLAVKFLNIATEPSKTVKGVIVHLTVDEGPVYKLSGVNLAGVTKEETDTLGKIAKFKIGEVVNFEDINSSVEQMKKSLIHEGYIHAESEVVRRMNDPAKTVGLLVKMNKGPQFHYGTLTIKGLDLYGEAQIEKLWSGKPGKAYSSEYADYFLTRIKEQGLFDDLGETKAIKQVDEEKHVVNITLDFKATPMKKEKRRDHQPGNPF